MKGAGTMNTVRGRILASFLALGLLLLGGVSFVALRQSERGLLELAEQEGQALTRTLTEGFDQYLAARSAFMEAAAKHGEMRSGDLERQKAFLSTLDASKLQIQAYFIIDLNGDGHYLDGRVNKLGDREYYLRARNSKSTVVGQPVLSRATGEMVVIIASPVLDGSGNVTSVLCGRITANTLVDRASTQKWGQTGYSVVTDSTGLMVVHPEKDYVGILNASVPGKELPDTFTSAVKRALGGESGVVRYSFEGVECVASYARIPSTGWAVLMVSPVDEFLTPVRDMRRIIFLALGAAVLLMIGVSILIAGSVSRPLAAVVAKMDSLARGDFSSRFSSGSSLA